MEKKQTIKKDPNTMYVSVRNFGIIRNAVIALEPGMTVLRGPSGSGKSTLMRAIEDTIYNTPGDTTVTNGESVQAVKIEYKGHSIIRRKDLNSRSDKTLYQVDGTIYGKLGRQPMQEVLQLLNMEELKLLDSKVRLSFVSQFASPFLIKESPPKIFETLTTTDQIDLPSILRQMRSDADELQVQRKALEASHNATTKSLTRDKVTVERLKQIPEKITRLQELQPKDQRLQRLKDTLSKRETSLKEGREVQQRLRELPELREPIQPERLNHLNTLVSPTYKLYKEIPQDEKEITRLKKLIGQIEQVPKPPEEKQRRLGNLKGIISQREQVERGMENIRDTLVTEISNPVETHDKLTLITDTLNTIEQLTEALTKIRGETEDLTLETESIDVELSQFDICPLCHQPLKKGEHVDGRTHQEVPEPAREEAESPTP